MPGLQLLQLITIVRNGSQLHIHLIQGLLVSLQYAASCQCQISAAQHIHNGLNIPHLPASAVLDTQVPLQLSLACKDTDF